MNLKEKFDTFVKKKHRSKLQLALVLGLGILSLAFLWQLVHWWIIIIAILAALNLAAIISYQKDLAVPFLETLLAKEYLRIKAQPVTQPALFWLAKQYQGLLTYLLILFLDSQRSFELFIQGEVPLDVKFDAGREILNIKTGDADIKKCSAKELLDFYRAKLTDHPELLVPDLCALYLESKKTDEFAKPNEWSVEEFFDLYKLKKKKIISFSLGASAGIILSIILLVFIIPSWHKLNAYTYGWNQTSWTQGASTTSVAVHPGDKTGWLKYFSAGLHLLAGSNISLTATWSTSTTDTSDADWQTATSSNTYISGGKIIMRKPLTANCTADTECTSNYCPTESNVCEVYPIACDGSEGAHSCNSGCTYAGVIYPTVQVNATTTTQCWMAKNLNVGTMLSYATTTPDDTVMPDPANPGTIQKWCYNNNETNPNPASSDVGGCNTDGGLYTWAEMMALSSACNSSSSGACAPSAYVTGSGASAKRQGICPSGWHIPSDYEFWGMENYFDSTVAYDNPDYYADQIGSGGTTGNRGTNIGTKLKCSTSGNPWTNCGSSNLKLPLAGVRGSSSFYNRVSASYVWSASQHSSATAWLRGLLGTQSNRSYGNKGLYGFTVRCIKD